MQDLPALKCELHEATRREALVPAAGPSLALQTSLPAPGLRGDLRGTARLLLTEHPPGESPGDTALPLRRTTHFKSSRSFGRWAGLTLTPNPTSASGQGHHPLAHERIQHEPSETVSSRPQLRKQIIRLKSDSQKSKGQRGNDRFPLDPEDTVNKSPAIG